MKKLSAILMVSIFLAAGSGLAQTKREHTRPPYSGPRKAAGGMKKGPPSPPHRDHAENPPSKVKSGHIQVR
jgi:hypothetical protein